VQAVLGLAALERLDGWTERTRRHARVMDQALGGLPGITVPQVPPNRMHVYYQYCVYGPQRDELVVRCVRRGIDIETLHVDVCSDMDLFAKETVVPAGAPGARRAAGAMQIPVYSSLTDEQAQRVAQVVRGVLTNTVGRNL
jgi:dTDP-4-amino-4,6-dideoxygalactose transaminase